MGIVDRLHALDARVGIGRIPRSLERRVDDWPGAREAWDVRDDDTRRAVMTAAARGEAPADPRDAPLWLAVLDHHDRNDRFIRGIALAVVGAALLAHVYADLTLAAIGGPLGVLLGQLLQSRRRPALRRQLVLQQLAGGERPPT